MPLKHFLRQIESDPKQLFLIDGIGAIFSAFLLGVVLVRFESVFGIPASTLHILAILPVFFAFYDLLSYRRDKSKLGTPLKVIAVMNLLYCCLSIGLAFYHFNTITIFGWAYILSEVAIVVIIAIIELVIANRIDHSKR